LQNSLLFTPEEWHVYSLRLAWIPRSSGAPCVVGKKCILFWDFTWHSAGAAAEDARDYKHRTPPEWGSADFARGPL